MRILIADDHVLLAESLRLMLESNSEIEVTGIAYNGLQAVRLCCEMKPDIVLMDIRMPDLDGIAATKCIKEGCPKTRVIILTSLEDGKVVYNAFSSGADAYLLKDTSPDKLITLIKIVYWGYHVSSPSSLQLMLDEVSVGTLKVPSEKLPELKEEELEMVRLISEGKSNSEIAGLMCFAEGTVKNKITRIIEATGVENRAQLVMFALKHNLL